MKKTSIIAWLTATYATASLQIRKKSRILAWTALVMAVIGLVIGLIMFATGALVVGGLMVFFFVFCASVLFQLRSGRYSVASSVFLYGLFLVMFAAIKFDAYINVYECYVFGTLGSFLLMTGALIASRPRQTMILLFLDLIAIALLYLLDELPQRAGVVDTLAIQSLATSCIMVGLSGVFATMLVKGQNQQIQEIEERAAASEKGLTKLNEAMNEVQGMAAQTGGQLAARASHVMEALQALKDSAAQIHQKMSVLSEALGRSRDANTNAASAQDQAALAMADYRQRATRVAADLGDVADTVQTMGQQASDKLEQVHALLDLSEAGQVKLGNIGTAIDRIFESAGRVLEMSTLIEDVADRTNLLGLNASIQAAHAGLAGKGFAVVAEQIRHLSFETGRSSQQIAQTLEETRMAIDAARLDSADAQDFFRRISGNIEDFAAMLDDFLATVKAVSSNAGNLLESVRDMASQAEAASETANASRQSIAVSSGGILQVADIAADVQASSNEMQERVAEASEDSQEVQGLGKRNLELVQILRTKLDA